MGRRLTLGIGDNREHCFYVPVGFQLIRLYLNNGFELEELVGLGLAEVAIILNFLIYFFGVDYKIIKRQRYCSAFGLGTYLCVQFDFLVFTHEFIATFKKVLPSGNDKMDVYDCKYPLFLSMSPIRHQMITDIYGNYSHQASKPRPNNLYYQGNTKVTHCTQKCGYGYGMGFQTVSQTFLCTALHIQNGRAVRQG
jgi:hypothetical protein